MEITKIEPNEKYVIVIPEIERQDEMERIVNGLESFLSDDMHTIFFIYGNDVTIVPSSQIVGYKKVKDGKC